MPISIAEAMATGAYVLARDANEFIDYIGDAGGIYSGVEQASRLISETQNWSDEIWSSIWLRAVERAYGRHADEIVLRQIFNDWMDYVLDVRGQFEPAEQIDSIID
jgi:glycosyltransferase involved in cell wall biosynthesis